MENQKMNLFIVDDNKLVVSDLKIFLNYKFGTDITISTFNDGESCLQNINEHTNIVILDYYLNGKNGLEILKEIKLINPKTEVIMLSSNDDIALAIQLFRNGATDYVTKGQGSLKKISNIVYSIITAPIRLIVREFGVSKYMAIFLLTFLIMGVTVYFTLRSMK